MSLISLRQLLDHAAENNYGVPAFNVNNLEAIRAIMEGAKELNSPVILQASGAARRYAGPIFVKKLVEAAMDEFSDIPTVLHQDHGGLEDKIKPLGVLNGKTIYSSLGDTNCVKRSFSLKNDECIVNLGTGSQVIRNKSIVKYIPSGRALNCFENFFNNLDVSVFEIFKNLSTDQLIASDMNFNLNVFEQALHYDSAVCGSITNIREDNFTLINFTCSLFKSYLDQYIPLIKNSKKIYLTGGISRKYPVIKKYFEVKTNSEVVLNSRHIEDTFLGIKEKVLADYEHINHGI